MLSRCFPPTETTSMITCYFLFRFPLGFSARWRICFSSSYGNGGGAYATRFVCLRKSIQLVWMATIPPTIRIHDYTRNSWNVNQVFRGNADMEKKIASPQTKMDSVLNFIRSHDECLGCFVYYINRQPCAEH